MVFGRFVTQIAERQRFAFFHWLISFPYQDAIHDDVGTDRQIRSRELVFGWNTGNHRVRLPGELNLISLFQISQGDQDIVSGIELQDCLHRVAVTRVEMVYVRYAGSPLLASKGRSEFAPATPDLIRART